MAIKTNFKGNELCFMNDELLGSAAAESFRNNIMTRYPYMDQNTSISVFLFLFFSSSNPDRIIPFNVPNMTLHHKNEKIKIKAVDGLVNSISHYRRMHSGEYKLIHPTKYRTTIC